MIFKRRQKVRLFSMFATFLMIISLMTPAMANSEANGSNSQSLYNSNSKQHATDKVDNRLLDDFSDQDEVKFLVKFSDKPEVAEVAEEAENKASSANLSGQDAKFMKRSAILAELKATSYESHKHVIDFLDEEIEAGTVSDYKSYHIVNGMAVTATKEVAEKIAAFPEVEKLLKNETRELQVPDDQGDAVSLQDDDEIEWNVDIIDAPGAWSMGIDGEGTVVASLDSGVQWDHPALKEKYFGYDAATGEVDHEYSFYDATAAGEEEAYDDVDHGTHVTGTMVGGEDDGSNQVGVAPGAEWMSVKVFDGAGSTEDDILLDGAEWILAPGGDASLAPDVVNNSWGGGPGIDEWYWDSVENWREYEIFPTFSAGNVDLFNPGGPESIAVPANYPISFAVGATDSDNMLADFSLQGPSPYDEIKPDVSAPGQAVRSAVPGDGYGSMNGTSMSSPAVSGVVAMLRQVNADLSVDDIEEILMDTAIEGTDEEFPESPNNGYGHGIVNAENAVASILDGLGTVEGQVTEEGEDDEAPEFNHDPLEETYVGMDLDLEIEASDNVSVTSVEVDYQVDGSETETVEADRVSGDHQDGVYEATIPGEDVNGDTLTYTLRVNDFGDNEVESDEYPVEIQEGISPGYTEDFETNPQWDSFGDENSWEWGEPTSGPEEANTNDNVYATNLDGEYDNSMDATLVMPPVSLPDSDAYLQLDHWYEFEVLGSGTPYDFGYVVVSTDGENWTSLETFEGETEDWTTDEVNLSEYSGQTIFVGFQATSDFSGTFDGWYIDQVSLTDSSMEESSASIGLADEDLNKVETTAMVKSDDTDITPAQLPLGATVNVEESGRTVNTNPADGSYSFTHATGDYTVAASAYGYITEEKQVTVEDEEVSTANFELTEKPQGTIEGTVTDENTGEPIADATLLLVEDANVDPVETDEDGKYSITAYEGDYTLKVMASDYHGKEVEVVVEEDTVEEADIELEPYYTYPGEEIAYDDGVADNARAFYDAFNGWAVKMSLPEGKDSAIVTDGVFKFWNPEFPTPGGTDFQVEVWDSSDDGMPGEKIAGPVDAEAVRDETDWTVVDLSEHNIMVEDDFYMVYIQTDDNTGAPGLATDETSPNAERSYQLVAGSWSPSPADEGNYMIRARVDYAVEDPVITSPTEDYITNDEEVTVEGTASPTTTVELMNNDEEVDSAEIGDDGEFSFTTTLNEGENELSAVSVLDGAETGESESVSITLDTEAPELTIDNPVDGDKSNRETVTVEGTVSDENLDYVEVNGQEADIDGEDYSKRILLDNGENEIEVTAFDLAGNETTETVTIDVKYDAPEIRNLEPTEDQELQTGESVKIKYDSEPGLRATYVVHMPLANSGDGTVVMSNPTEFPMMEMADGEYVGYWTVPTGAYADGAVIEVKAEDRYGNEARDIADGKLFINLE